MSDTDRCFSALIVRHKDGRLFRTAFGYDRKRSPLKHYTVAAREYGWTPVAIVRVTQSDLPGDPRTGLVEIA